jgi:hypothetical protein
MTTFTTKFMMAVLVFALITVAGLAQAKQPMENRFVVLPPGDWVLDTNSKGLRWQQEPGSANVVGAGASCNGPTACGWQEAADYCAALGGGSRLPEVKELISLVEYNGEGVEQAGRLNTLGFTAVQDGFYWSAIFGRDVPFAWAVGFNVGVVTSFDLFEDFRTRAWCVR